MGDLLFSTTILAAFLGGVVALLAPCCVSVMLPAYFASSFKSRTHILAMTLVFAAGVATVILPIGLGATALSRLISGHHTLVFSVMGAAMMLGGLAMLAGRKFMLPMPGLRSRGGTGTGSVYTLGVFSGAASSCCAPVLVGVAALSAATASFVPSLIVGVTYVFGMVAPLAALALVWDRRDWGRSRLLTGREVTFGVGRWRHRLPLASLFSGGLLVGMGVLTVFLAARGPSMPTDGWQVRFTAWLGHSAATVEVALSWLPPWVPGLAIIAVLSWLIWHAVHHPAGTTRPDSDSAPVATGQAAGGTPPMEDRQ
ncbi:MAG: cytochrome c biogenesis protein CcdA [Nocardioides sp.]|nr:cytochrome c biogenesis protein CcdA [Nocardioides sp.]